MPNELNEILPTGILSMFQKAALASMPVYTVNIAMASMLATTKVHVWHA